MEGQGSAGMQSEKEQRRKRSNKDSHLDAFPFIINVHECFKIRKADHFLTNAPPPHHWVILNDAFFYNLKSHKKAWKVMSTLLFPFSKKSIESTVRGTLSAVFLQCKTWGSELLPRKTLSSWAFNQLSITKLQNL